MGYSVKNILIIATGGTIVSTDSGDGLVPAIDVKSLFLIFLIYLVGVILMVYLL